MISGTVIALDDPPLTGKPIISIAVANVSDRHRSKSFRGTVDTGFTGFLTLRSDAIAQLRLPFVTNQPAVLASGDVGTFDVHAGRVVWHSQERLIPIYSIDSDPLVGMALLWNCRLTMDVIPNGSITIIPLPS